MNFYSAQKDLLGFEVGWEITLVSMAHGHKGLFDTNQL